MHGPFTRIVTVVALLTGPTLVGVGLFQVGIHVLPSAWQPGTLLPFVTFVAIVAFAAGVVLLLPGSSSRLCATALALGAIVWAFEPAAVLTVALLIAGAAAWGSWLAFDPGAEAGHPQQPVIAWITRAAVGFAVLVCLANSLMPFAVNGRALYLGLLLAPMIVQARPLVELSRSIARWLLDPNANATGREGALLLTVVLAVHAAHGALPELYYDALAMHLYVPTFVSVFGRWTFDAARYAWAVMPLGADWLFSYAFVLGGEMAAKLLNVAFGGATTWLLYLALRRSLSASWSALLTAACMSAPIFVLQSTTLYVENTLMFFMLSGYLLVEQLTRHWRSWLGLWLVLAALCSVKLHGAVFAVGLVLIAGWRAFRSRDAKPTALALGLGAGAALLALQPYASAAWRTGNPLFPFFNRVFKSPFYPFENLVDPRYARGWSLESVWGMTFEPSRTLESGSPGALGYLVLALGPFALWAIIAGRARVPWRAVAACAWFLVVVGSTVQYIRYLSPVLPLVTLSAVAILQVGGRIVRSVILVVLLAVVLLNFVSIPSGGWVLGGFYPARLLDAAGRSGLVRDLVPQRVLNDVIRQRETQPATVAYFGTPVAAGLAGTAIFYNWYNTTFTQLVYQAQTEDEVARLMGDAGVEYVIASVAEDYTSRALIARTLRSHATLVDRIGNAELFLLDRQFRLGKEMLENAGFDRDVAGWSAPTGALEWGSGGVAVLRPGTFAAQVAPITGTVRRFEGQVLVNCMSVGTIVTVRLEWSYAERRKFNPLSSDRGACAGSTPMALRYVGDAPVDAEALQVVLSTAGDGAIGVDEISLRPDAK